VWTESSVESAKETSRVQLAQTIPCEVSPNVGGMIRSVGNDLRNKLGVMKNSIYYLNMRLGYADEKVRKHLQILGSNISNANRTVADLVDFTLVNKPVFRKSDIRAIVGEALSQASLPDHWQAVVHLDDGLPPLMADAMQLQTAFTSIILRIVEGAPKAGKLQIIADRRDGFMEIGFGAPGFTISEEDRAAMVNSLVSGGISNLGMFVSKRIVESHGGTIGVISLAGEGTMFTVRLPLASEVATRHEQESQHFDN
jgi:signal transduction histidine kinase